MDNDKTLLGVKNRVLTNYITTIIGTILMLVSTAYVSIDMIRESVDIEYTNNINWFLFTGVFAIGLILIGAKDTVIKQILSLKGKG